MGVQLDQFGCLRNVEGGQAGQFLWSVYRFCRAGEWPENGTTWEQTNQLVEMVDVANSAYAGMNERKQ